MKIAFEKLCKCHTCIWLIVMFNLIASLMIGFIKKFNNVFTIISRADIYKLIKKYTGDNTAFEIIERYIGIGIGVILILYLIVLFLYIIIVFGVPNIMYCINKAIIKNYTGTATNIVVWLLCFLSFIPGIWCTTKMILLFTLLLGVDIILLHLLVLFLTQISMIITYIIIMIQSIINKGDNE